jgi:alkanesulfonate monooxygenase SsuD/methylene tetrahydromethanopterin reductase-like flavin-dependent oxidoreductase (luciferase family)
MDVSRMRQTRGRIGAGDFLVAGAPGVMADAIETWLDDSGIDGITLLSSGLSDRLGPRGGHGDQE